MRRIVIAAVFVAATLAVCEPAPVLAAPVLAAPVLASPASQGCVYDGGGCINLDNDGDGNLWVHTVQPGSWGLGKTRCGMFHIRLTRKSNGIPTIIRTSPWGCSFIPHGYAVMGPKWTLDHAYADGDVFCGNFDGWLPKEWGCVVIKA